MYLISKADAFAKKLGYASPLRAGLVKLQVINLCCSTFFLVRHNDVNIILHIPIDVFYYKILGFC